MAIERNFQSAPRRLRIGIVTETDPPEINGVALTLARWVEGLRQRGHHLQLIRARQGGGDAPEPADSFETLCLPGFRIPGYPQLQGGWPAYGALLAHWRRVRPDLVHIVTEGPLGYAARGCRAAAGNPSLHQLPHPLSQLQPPLPPRLVGGADPGLPAPLPQSGRPDTGPTGELAERLPVREFCTRRVSCARGLEDTTLFSPRRRDLALRQQWGAAADVPVVLHVGRLAAEKNLELAITAFEAIRRIQPAARLVLVGDGPLAARLHARHPEFVYCGMRRGEDLAAHYASADLFLFPSLTETFGNVVLKVICTPAWRWRRSTTRRRALTWNRGAAVCWRRSATPARSWRPRPRWRGTSARCGTWAKPLAKPCCGWIANGFTTSWKPCS